jgi:Rax2 C-terminal beta propeller domain/Secretion system C-terminal sorting domain
MIHLNDIGLARLHRLTASIALMLFLTFGAAYAQSSGSVRTILNPDGSLKANLPTGSFNTHGYMMTLTSDGSPRFARTQSDPNDVNWDSRFTVPGVGGQVFALATDGTYLYVGGVFGTVGNVVAHGIAKYDLATKTWSPLDSAGVGVGNGAVTDILVNNGVVYISGQFTTAGTTPAADIAEWNPATGWSALGTGLNSNAWSMLYFGGSLYVGGSFTTAGGGTVNHIAKWDSSTSTWSGLGTGTNGTVYLGMVVVSGTLYAGGAFTTAGGVTVNHIAAWNGTTWSALGSGTVGTDGQVDGIVDAGDTALYVTGLFANAGGNPAAHVAKYSIGSNSWSALGGGVNGPAVTAFLDGDSLYVVGVFTTAGIISAQNVALWNIGTSSWTNLGAGINSDAYRVLAANGIVYVGGFMTEAGTTSAYGIASWDGASWAALATGTGSVGGSVDAIAVRGDSVFVGGNFETAGSSQAQNIAIWDRTTGQWSALDNTSTIEGVNGVVYAIYPTASGDVYIGGSFTEAGNISANHIVKWNPSTGWSALGTGTDTTVYGITMVSTNLYACGMFTHAGGNAANYVAQWNGTTWSALGSGLSDIGRAITLAGGEIYVGGDFATAGGNTVNYIASWNGSTWGALGNSAGTDDYVYAIAVKGDSVLYVGGLFANAGGSPASGIARYSISGNSWSSLGGGLGNTNDVRSVVVSGDTVYAGGYFTTAGLLTANSIAVWNIGSKTWSTVGSGTDGGVLAIATGANSDLYAGGLFSLAGGKPSYRFARYNANLTPVNEPPAKPKSFALAQNYPNPFNPTTVIGYQLSAVSHVRLRVYDILGRSVATLVDGVQSPGEHSVVFDGSRFASGVYFYRIQTGSYVRTMKMVLMK